MANRKRIGLTAVVGSGVALILGIVVAQVFPAQAAPPPPSATPVVVTNTPLPVSGDVQVTGGVVVTNTPLPVSGDVQVTGDVVVSGTTEAIPVLPNAPFTRALSLINNNRETVGIPESQMGLTSITITNFDSIPHQLNIFRPVLSGTSCTPSAIVGGASPNFDLLIGARSTLHLPFPTPLVFGALGGVTCLATQVATVQSGAVEVIFNGLGE